jgi:hypothetical protein
MREGTITCAESKAGNTKQARVVYVVFTARMRLSLRSIAEKTGLINQTATLASSDLFYVKYPQQRVTDREGEAPVMLFALHIVEGCAWQKQNGNGTLTQFLTRVVSPVLPTPQH